MLVDRQNVQEANHVVNAENCNIIFLTYGNGVKPGYVLFWTRRKELLQ